MDGQIDTQVEDQTSAEEVDPWAAAFAALDKTKQNDEERAGDEQHGAVDADQVADSDGVEAADSDGSEGDTGEPDTDTGNDIEPDDGTDRDLLNISAEEVEEFRNQLTESIRDRAVSEMAQEFVKRGIRNQNGKLGATINDPDICKRDEDGVPRFYNPETGQEFTGENPRRQAQEWVEDYNKELASAFNQACENYSAKLLEDEQSQIAVMEFAPTYDGLDPIRQQMLDAVIEDYEVTNANGDVVGYSCDLNVALAAVDRQVAVIQEWGKANTPKQEEAKPTSPALDIKNSAGAVRLNEKPKFTSLAEEIEWIEDQKLAKLKEGK